MKRAGSPTKRPETDSLSRNIRPVFAGFSLPTIAQLVVDKPGSHGVSIAFFVSGTGFLLAGYQLSINGLMKETRGPKAFRATLTYIGMILIMIGLGVLAKPVQRVGWIPICILGLGLGLPIAAIVVRHCREALGSSRNGTPLGVKIRDWWRETDADLAVNANQE